jgi:hypothetical protein
MVRMYVFFVIDDELPCPFVYSAVRLERSQLFQPNIFKVYNKRVLAVWPAPLTLGSLQLGIGALYAVTIWNLGLRKRPQQLKTKWPLFKVGMCNAFGQLCTMASLGAGSVAFTNIVKVCFVSIKSSHARRTRCEIIHDHVAALHDSLIRSRS